MRRTFLLTASLAAGCPSVLADGPTAPIVDVHLHALTADYMGPPPLAFCLPTMEWPAHDPARPYAETFQEWERTPQASVRSCENLIWSATKDSDLTERTLEILDRRNIIGVTSGPLTREYVRLRPDRIIPGIMFSAGSNPPTVEELRSQVENNEIAVFGEITNQYDGVLPDDPRFEPYLQLAEELDIPVGIHVGPGPPGVIYLGAPNMRGRMHSALTLEEVLVRHPRLRLYVMHAGWPLADDMIALMYNHPQVYAGLGVISFANPRTEFHNYLRRLVAAGFGNRLMFGSDHMVWPDALEYAIEGIESAEFLSEQQKRDILYNNAARFFRFTEEQVNSHHGR